MKTVLEAQLHNAAQMSARQLSREIHWAETATAQPAIRRQWLDVLQREQAQRASEPAKGQTRP